MERIRGKGDRCMNRLLPFLDELACITGTRTCSKSAIAPMTLAIVPTTTAVTKIISVGLVPYRIQAEGGSMEPEFVITTWTG
ncbi:MAG: hypothetical protein KME27_19560 [Lyngbya sp. HA4199-MV5]|nr:hypothetical protein [Lyngbya sp. HA4199-MV5]